MSKVTLDIDNVEDRFLDALQRARAEFIEMPGLQLTLAQAARLWDLDRESCHTLLSTLVDAGFLVKTRNASFARA
jgi:DNA-binding IclR family transcriptional regulator